MTVIEYFKGSDKVKEEFDQEVTTDMGNKVRHGKYTRYWLNGNKAAEGRLSLGRREGLWVFWYATGIKEAEVEYSNGEAHGDSRSYHTGGGLSIAGKMLRGRRVGVWSSWYPNGSLKSEGRYDEEGNFCGTWTFWDEDGKESTVDYSV